MGYRPRKWLQDEEGTAVVEYALLLAVMVVVSIGAWIGLGNKIKLALGTCTNSISQPLG
jgi:Flp pilus assembly pilin Flp